MSETPAWTSAIEWMTLRAAAGMMGETPGRVRRMIDDHQLVAMRIGGELQIPVEFFADARPLPSLRGTVIVLLDRGFSTDDVIEWLFAPEESIGEAPLAMLRAGRKSEVRRVAQSQG